ncbi:hypothetical protein [Meiothermus taiwanensis]|jgi:hypothetical protein|uniref:Lipoprotein n=1 Tax=Meiothermus taiwanensis WR-220 TaxID=1339250 RepID=A0ABN5LWH6_9DEIN|nr:hypothetical protein [Meiothermus taiwanensis]AWR86218.1 hypothetical protein Mtai_v1c09740 [Meiothermus taiwanensis WR-220]KIQ55877.1 hypothetical protein SY28_01270 [Meiothermus taiwanensis]KZK14891.1 hypothetical protein A3962_03185 [Meiothermus taiwanensis]
MPRLAFALLLLLLAGCSASTRYTFQFNILSFIPENQRSLNIPSGYYLAVYPGLEGQRVPLPITLDILERGQLTIQGSLVNNGSIPMTGSYEIRLAPESDNNLNDNSGGDVGLGSNSFNVAAGQSQSIATSVNLSATDNSAAFNIIKSGSFRIAIRVEVNSNGGRFNLTTAQVTVIGRPFALIK